VKERIATSVFWIGWSKGVLQAISFFATLVVARLLDPHDYGLAALSGIWVSGLILFAELGLGNAVIQFRDIDNQELNYCFWLTVGTTVTGYLAIYALAPWVAIWFASPQLAEVLRYMSVALVLVGLRVVPDGLLRKRLCFDKVAQAEILAILTTIPLQIMLAWMGAGVWALVAGMLMLQLVQTASTFYLARWWPGFRLGGPRLKEILGYSLTTLGGRLSWGIFDQVDAFVLGKMFGDTALGVYSMGKQLALLPVHKIAVVINQLTHPVMAELQQDKEQMKRVLLRQIRLVGCLTTPLCIGFALVADDVILVALTEKWLPAVPLVRVLCLYAAWQSLSILLPPILFARFRTKVILWWNTSLLVVMPVAFWAGAVWQGTLGLTLAWITAYPLLTLIIVYEVNKELDLQWSTLGLQLLPIVKATLMMSIAVLMFRSYVSVSDTTEAILRLVPSAILGALSYAAVIYWQGRHMIPELTEVFGWLFRRQREVSPAR